MPTRTSMMNRPPDDDPLSVSSGDRVSSGSVRTVRNRPGLLRLISSHRATIGYVVLTIGIVFALAFEAKNANDIRVHAARAHVETCEAINSTQHRIIDFVDRLSTASRASAQATLASPNATPAQKAVATANLARLDTSAALLEKQFADIPCKAH